MAKNSYTGSGLHYAADIGGICQIMTANVVVAAGQTDSVIIAAQAGRKIRVLGVTVGAAGTATTWTLGSKGSGATTAKMGPISSFTTGAICIYGDYGLFDCVDEEGLVVTTGAGANQTFFINYVLV